MNRCYSYLVDVHHKVLDISIISKVQCLVSGVQTLVEIGLGGMELELACNQT